jgi:hypothetical protein
MKFAAAWPPAIATPKHRRAEKRSVARRAPSAIVTNAVAAAKAAL